MLDKFTTQYRFIGKVSRSISQFNVKEDIKGTKYYVSDYNEKVDLREGDMIIDDKDRMYVFDYTYGWTLITDLRTDEMEKRRKARIGRMEHELSGKTFQEIAEYVVDHYIDLHKDCLFDNIK